VTLTPAQCKAARELLGWSVVRLCRAARVSAKTIYNLEGGEARLSEWAQIATRQALEAAGVAFENDGRITLGDRK
jgi:transcriptional regulator with XRE-family HTH domain